MHRADLHLSSENRGFPGTHQPTPYTITTDKWQLLRFPSDHAKLSCLSISLVYIQRTLWSNRDAIRHSIAYGRRLLTRGLTAESPHWQVKLAEMGYTVCSFHLRTQYTRPDVANSPLFAQSNAPLISQHCVNLHSCKTNITQFNHEKQHDAYIVTYDTFFQKPSLKLKNGRLKQYVGKSTPQIKNLRSRLLLLSC